MFFAEPVCNGKHGWGCARCHHTLSEVERVRQERLADIRRVNETQPWQLAA